MTKKILTTEEFDALDKAERCVLIAKDVISQIKVGSIRAITGDYVRSFKTKAITQPWSHEDAQCAIKDPTFKCESCARGSLFISAVKFKNKLNIEEVNDARFDYTNIESQKGTEYLGEEFTVKQQALIETAFEFKQVNKLSEQIDMFIPEIIEKDEYHEIVEFYKNKVRAIEFNIKYTKAWTKLKAGGKTKFKKADYILTKICENIVINNGEFQP